MRINQFDETPPYHDNGRARLDAASKAIQTKQKKKGESEMCSKAQLVMVRLNVRKTMPSPLFLHHELDELVVCVGVWQVNNLKQEERGQPDNVWSETYSRCVRRHPDRPRESSRQPRRR